MKQSSYKGKSPLPDFVIDAACAGNAEAVERGIQHRGSKRITRAGGVDHFRRPQFAAQDRAGIVHVQTALRAEADEQPLEALV